MTSGVIDIPTFGPQSAVDRKIYQEAPLTDMTAIVDLYIAGFNEPDAQLRRSFVARAFTEDARYVDPLIAGEGTDGITSMIGAVHNTYPNTRFELAGTPDHHHDRVRFSWHLRAADGGEPLATGHDFATVAPDGRLADVTGFLDAT